MEPQFWETIQLAGLKKSKIDLGWITFNRLHYFHEGIEAEGDFLSVGIDPGINFGITILCKNFLEVIWGKLPRKYRLPGFEAMELVKHLTSEGLLSAPALWKTNQYSWKFVGIEGPAYNETVGQPLLEQVRFGFAIGFKLAGYNPMYIPPMTARKLALGHGRKKGNEIWVTINQNGADSIPLALAGLKLRANSGDGFIS